MERNQTLFEKMKTLSKQYDIKLDRKQYLMLMLDGRTFSKLIKNKFKKPFDVDFINMMNETAKYIATNVSDCKFIFTQSDEISILLSIMDNPKNDGFYGWRLTKLCSVIPSMASTKFQQLYNDYLLKKLINNDGFTKKDIVEILSKQKLIQFDCKCFNLSNFNDVNAWFICRQNDCIRNSKSQLCQTYLPHNSLQKLTTDEQINLLLKEKGINWHELPNSQKFGRFIYPIDVEITSSIDKTVFLRKKWNIDDAIPLNDNKDFIKKLNLVPII